MTGWRPRSAGVGAAGGDRPRPPSSARLRLALSYAAFLVAAGGVVLVGVYIVLHEVPNYPLTAANPRNRPVAPTRDEILGSLLSASGYLLGALALVGTVGGWILAGRVLRPLRHINEAARIAAAGKLDHRIRLRGPNDEFRQVADSFDAMLDRLQESFAVRERFAANASHELRTPLAVTATMLDVAAHDPGKQTDARLLERLTETNQRSLSLIDELLHLSQVDHVTDPEPVDLAEIARAALAEKAEDAARAGIAVESRLDPAQTTGNGTLLAQVAANLVQNSIRHNLEEAGLVRVTTGRAAAAERVVLAVENTGAVYDGGGVQRLREPFLRGAGRVSTDRSGGPGQRGHGLGLALVDRIVRVHGGELDISPRPGGGLVITVALPEPEPRPCRPSRTRRALRSPLNG
ncbi:sensor histidine kinase [Streptomonospora litoralis]|uniref:Signal transduction histidine-protein kinase/phosphatase MprB n=1 Tax=Streptomonospora litoralis TaxID=2498135 RepID=A0A4P6QA66_9ACTN|nr:HAMP domain-containing sensor histidine kinase [Streptomonospora litoralis]QBI56601.1 Alkaline phosphatase synthesis sensor protein PhoR [Streptomonospora litoralis]